MKAFYLNEVSNMDITGSENFTQRMIVKTDYDDLRVFISLFRSQVARFCHQKVVECKELRRQQLTYH